MIEFKEILKRSTNGLDKNKRIEEAEKKIKSIPISDYAWSIFGDAVGENLGDGSKMHKKLMTLFQKDLGLDKETAFKIVNPLRDALLKIDTEKIFAPYYKLIKKAITPLAK